MRHERWGPTRLEERLYPFYRDHPAWFTICNWLVSTLVAWVFVTLPLIWLVSR